MQYDGKVTGKIIRFEREKRKWTQDKLGSKIHISSKQISKYESGALFPPINMLLALCKEFDCELGYLLGEDLYKDGTKLYTAIHKLTGLTVDSIKAIQKITGSDRKSLDFGYNSENYSRILNKLFISNLFPSFIESLAELDNCENKLHATRKQFESKYDKSVANKAVNCYISSIDYEHDVKTETLHSDISKAYTQIDEIIDKQHNISYQIKVARYELSESFSELINDLYPKDNR